MLTTAFCSKPAFAAANLCFAVTSSSSSGIYPCGTDFVRTTDETTSELREKCPMRCVVEKKKEFEPYGHVHTVKMQRFLMSVMKDPTTSGTEPRNA